MPSRSDGWGGLFKAAKPPYRCPRSVPIKRSALRADSEQTTPAARVASPPNSGGEFLKQHPQHSVVSWLKPTSTSQTLCAKPARRSPKERMESAAAPRLCSDALPDMKLIPLPARQITYKGVIYEQMSNLDGILRNRTGGLRHLPRAGGGPGFASRFQVARRGKASGISVESRCFGDGDIHMDC